MRKISETEFFWENPQMLGFTNPTRATVMVVKELIDNALDACEEVSVLPEIYLIVDGNDGLCTVICKDNGSGIPKPQVNVPKAFGELLYGSKFGVFKQERGQQGIGVSAAFLWSQKTSSEPVEVITRYYEDETGYRFLLSTKGKGKVVIKKVEEVDCDVGTAVRMTFQGSKRAKNQLLKYLEGVAIANPEANIHCSVFGEYVIFERSCLEPSRPAEEIKPHPHSADIGVIEELIASTGFRTVKSLLQNSFSGVGNNIKEIEQKVSFSLDISPKRLKKPQIKQLVDAIKSTKFRNPPKSCLSPLEDRLVLSLKRYNPKFVNRVTRNMVIVNGHPTIVEAAVAILPQSSPFSLIRLANKTPLVYDEGNCAIMKALKEINFRRYGFQVDENKMPLNTILVVHVCSTNVLFGNQAKTYIAPIDELVHEIKRAVQMCLNKASTYISKQEKKKMEDKKVEELYKVMDLLAEKVSEIVEQPKPDVVSIVAEACRKSEEEIIEVLNTR